MEADGTEEQHSRHRPPALGSSPWLIYAHGKGKCNQIFYNLSERSYHVRRIPEMRQKEILTSLYGWLLLLDVRTRDLTLLNPSSMQKIQLPPFKNYFHKNWCFLLSRPPDDPNSLVMCIKKGKDQLVMFCKPGDLDWTSKHLTFHDGRDGDGDGDGDEDKDKDKDNDDDDGDGDEDKDKDNDDDDDDDDGDDDDRDGDGDGDEDKDKDKDNDDDDDDDGDDDDDRDGDGNDHKDDGYDDDGGGFHFAVVCKGEIYIQTKKDWLLVLKIEDYDIKLVDLGVDLPQPQRRPNRGHTTVLVGSSDDLFVIFPYCIGQYDKQFEIFRMDLEKDEWIPVESLEGRAVFFNDHRGIIAPTSCEGEGEGSVIRDNKIYVTQPDDPCLYEYDIQEMSVEISLPCDPKLAKNLQNPIWAYSLLVDIVQSQITYS
ncbi:hypothetical protein Tsubulata_029577, partial [Turnera subulata]